MKEIKRFRTSLGLSQMELAVLLGVRQSAINNYENGHRFPCRKILRKIINLSRSKNVDVSIEQIILDPDGRPGK